MLIFGVFLWRILIYNLKGNIYFVLQRRGFGGLAISLAARQSPPPLLSLSGRVWQIRQQGETLLRGGYCTL